jgi:aspartate/methionine/tyrosine aminotransferase
MTPRRRASRLAISLASLTRRKAQLLPPGVIRFDQGDPYFNTPEPIRHALMEAVESGVVHYADPEGDPMLRQAVADRISDRTGRTCAPNQTVITHGATAALAAAILATVDQGEGVIIPEPSYSLYADLVHMAGGVPLYAASPAPEFRLDIEAVEALAPRARIIVLCHPCNPTGTVYTRPELEEVARIAERYDLLLVSDEAYDHIVYQPEAFTSALDVRRLTERLLYVQTFSKTYAMTGWRVGYLVAPPDLAAACARIHRTLVGPVNSAVQRAAMVALAHGDEWHVDMLHEYRERRDLVVEALRDTPCGPPARPPEGTFYILAAHPDGVSSEQMAEIALREGVAVRPGSEYGASSEGFVRIAYTLGIDELLGGMARLRRAFEIAAHAPSTAKLGLVGGGG